MNWNFGFFDADTVRRAAIAAGLGTGASALFPEEGDGAVYSKDGRRLLNLLDNASKGALRETEPVFEFQEKLPKDIFATANQNGGELKTRNFAATRNNIQHYWNERHKHMTNQEIEDSVEALITGNERFYVEANKPYPHSIAALGQEKTGVRGSLAPSDNYTFLHQLNPLNNRRLLKMRSPMEMPDGSAGHPLAHTSEGRGLRSKRVSADGISEQNIADFSVTDKLKLPAVGLGSGLGAGLTLSPEEAFGWGQGGLRTSELKTEDVAPLRTGELLPSDIGGNVTADLRLSGTPSSEGTASPFWGDMARQFGLGTRGVLEGLGSGLTLGLFDSGKGLSDLAGLPTPQNETEQGRVDLNSALAGVAGTSLFGAGLAKAPGAVLSGAGRAMSADPVADAMLTLTDENFAKMLEYGNNLMDLLEQYEDDGWGE